MFNDAIIKSKDAVKNILDVNKDGKIDKDDFKDLSKPKKILLAGCVIIVVGFNFINVVYELVNNIIHSL